MPLLGGSLSEYCHNIWYRRTGVVGLPDGEKSLRICLLVLLQNTNVTDGWTDSTALWYRPRCA